MIKLGTTGMAKAYVGSTEVSKVYLGSDLVYTKEVLPYDAEVSYLASNSEAYIDTGISGNNNNLEITIKFLFTTFVAYGAIWGNWVATGTNCNRLILDSSSGNGLVCINSATGGTGNNSISISPNVPYSISVKRNSITINGTSSTPSNLASGTANNNNIALFNRSVTDPNTTRNIGLRIYSCQIRDNGVLVRDFIPVRVGQVGYMYDKISGLLFGNVGTGAFTFGVTPYDAEISYIQNTSKACIVTNYIPTGPNIKIQGKFYLVSYSGAYSQWFTAYTSETADAYRIIRKNTNNGVILYTCGSKAGANGSATISGLNNTYEFELTRSQITINGVTSSFTPVDGTTNTGKFTIFPYTGNTVFTNGRLYYLKVFDGNTAIFDFIPVRIGQVGFLYDKISGELFENNGTGSFTLGNDI